MKHAHVRLFAAAFVSLTSIAGCAAQSSDADSEDEDTGASSESALSSGGGRTTLYYLGSSSFLRRCAGNTLGCGRAVASVSDSTPYFSAPRTWPRSTCDDWYTFRANGKCVEAQRFEVSDRRNFIEGNPAVFRALGLSYSDGSNCGGSGRGTATLTPGRHCNSSQGPANPPNSTTPDDDTDTPAAAGSCYSATLTRTVPEKTCVQSRSNGVWYQCNDAVWWRGVEGEGDSGPYGACVSKHPLP